MRVLTFGGIGLGGACMAGEEGEEEGDGGPGGDGQRFGFCEEKRMPFRCGRGGLLTSDMLCDWNWKL
jgi:hypothetical protein